MAEIQPIGTGVAASAWDDYVRQTPGATFFHLSGWQRVLEATFPYRSYSCAAVSGRGIEGVLPLYRVRTLPTGHSLVSTPLAVYGGVAANDEATKLALLRHAQATAERLGVRYLELRNQESIEGLPAKDLYVTFRKEIHPDRDRNMAAVPRNQRRSIRQGEKFALSSTIGGEELLQDFYHVYSTSLRNLGTPAYPISLFRRMLREFGPACRILAVAHEGRTVAAVLTFFFRDEVIPYYGGSLRAGFRLAANDFMYWRLLCYGAENGYRVFDFGRSKRGSGSFAFKRHWGFEPSPLAYQYHLVRQANLPDLSPRNPRFSLPIQVWRRLPLWVTQRVGPAIVQFFP